MNAFMKIVNQRWTRAAAAVMSLGAAGLASAGELVYVEQGGAVMMEAETYSDRTTFSSHDWQVVPIENAGPTVDVGSNPINNPYLNARDGLYMQSFPVNSGSTVGTTDGPFLLYKVRIDTTGIWKVYMRASGHDGNSDSMFISLLNPSGVHIADGTGPDAFGTGANLIADWYEQTTGGSADFSTAAWKNDGQAEINAGGASGHPTQWNITTPGVYTLRIDPREDGLSVDAIAFQHSSVAAPTGLGGFQTDVHITPDADSYVQLGNATTNFGSSTEVVVKNTGAGSTTRKGYVRFDVSNVHNLVTDAALQLQVKLNDLGTPAGIQPQLMHFNVWGLNDENAGEDWIESGAGSITWNNAPANDTADNDIDLAQASFLGTFEVPAIDAAANTVIVKFSDLDSATQHALIDFINDEIADAGANRDGLVTFILTRVENAGDLNSIFHSSESTTGQAPTLILSFVPEPTTALLMGVASLTLLRRRR